MPDNYDAFLNSLNNSSPLDAKLLNQDRKEKARKFSLLLKEMAAAVDEGINLDKTDNRAFLAREWVEFRACMAIGLLALVNDAKELLGDKRNG